jgi:hypothetical protein
VTAAVVGISGKMIVDKKVSINEETEVKKAVETAIKQFDELESDDVLKLMRRNVAELREYYTIHKQQARKSFTSALIICFLGFILFVTGVIVVYLTDNKNVIVWTTLSGAIVEIVSGLFFWLYSKSLKQINIFHESLLKSEKFLTAIQLTERLSVENRDTLYSHIIKTVIHQNENTDEVA